MAAEEIARLKVTTEGDQAALQSLTKIDRLISKINGQKVNISFSQGMKEAEAAAQRSAEAINASTAAEARAIEAKVKLVNSESRLAVAHERTIQAQERTKQATERTAQAVAKKAAEEAKAAAQTARLAQAQERTAQAEISRNTAEIQGFTARTRLAQSENTLAAAQERTAQAVERTKQVIAAQTTEEIKAAAAKTKLAQAEVNRASAQERSYQAAQKTAQEEEKTAQAREKTIQSQNRLALEEMRQQEREQQRLRQGYAQIGAMILRSVTQNIRKATDELKAMNAEMVSIQKVTGATDADMERLKSSAFEVAGAVGSTPSDYLASVTKWAQAGYGALSEQLGELSAKTQVVGDVNEETANKFLLAVDAAYKYKGNIDALTRVLDGANEISNNYATSVEKLAGGMGIVSSLAEQAGMKVEETMAAIGTITAKTQESGNSAARALRALILNIQGSTEIEIDAETGERWTEDEIQRTAAALGELNVATREYKNGIMELRNPMEVIGELAEKYREGLVTEAQLQEVVASLGGKVRSNQLMALIQGYETYVSMIETYKDALGSADKELDIYLAGWEAKSNKLTAQWAEFVESFKATDIATGMLDVGNFFLELANTDWGNAVTQIGAVTAAILALKAAAKTDKGAAILGILNAVPNGLKGITNKAAQAAKEYTGLTAAFKGAQAGAGTLVKSIYSVLGPVGLMAVGLTVASTAYDLLGRQAKKAAEKLSDARAEYEESSAKLESLQDELKTTQERIDELNGKGDSLTVVEQEELEKLKQQNIELERQVKLQEILNEARKAERDAAAREALDKGYSGADMGLWERFAFATSDDPKQVIKNQLSGRDFAEGAQWLSAQLDRLNRQKEEFLGQKPDAGTWTEEERKRMEALDEELETYRSTAIQFRSEMLENAADLSSPELVDYWIGLGEIMYASIAPAEALIEKFNRLTDAMDEAERTRFDEELKRIQADGKVTAQEVQTLLDKFPGLKVLLEGNAGALDTLAQHLTEATAKIEENTAAQEENIKAGEAEETAWEQIAAKLKKYTDQVNDVRDAQEELKKTGKLSFETLVGLLGKYGNAVNDVVIKALNGQATQEEIFKALELAYEKDVQHYREAMLEKEMDNEDFYSAWLAGNAETVNALLTQYGIDARNYKTFAALKEVIEKGTQGNLTGIEKAGAKTRDGIYDDSAKDFSDAMTAMENRAATAAGNINSSMQGAMAAVKLTAQQIANIQNGKRSHTGNLYDERRQLKEYNESKRAAEEQAAIWESVFNTLAVPTYPTGGSSKSKESSSSGKDWYETQIDNLKTLEEQTKRTNQVLERSDEDTARQRVDNLRKVQEKILAAQKQFIARGKSAASDQVNQLKIMYAELGDDIAAIYEGMNDKLLQQHQRMEKDMELGTSSGRTLEQVEESNRRQVEQYRKMQQEVHAQAEFYRSQGVRENEAFMRELGDAWWDYQKEIDRVFESLSDHFKDYIDESAHKIEELGRATGTVGQRIELYAQRIAQANKTLAALQAGGGDSASLREVQEQIWSDQDAIRDLQDSLWDELENAFDDIFDRAQGDIDAIGDEIEEIQDRMGEINDVLEEYDKELEGILKPINQALEKLNDQLEAERKRLEALTDPLSERREDLENQISGYYTVNPDGSMGPYIKGLDDDIQEIQDQIDKANEELDRVNDAWNEQKNREEEALALQKKQLAVEEAQKAVQDALLALQTARNERNIYTLKDGVWAWRADEEAVAKAEKALAEAEKAKEEAEKELQDYKEEQAHKQIVKRLEEQIRALEEQKKLLDRQKDLINKQIEALNKQIKAFEKESSARQEYIQNLIDQKEEEKKAWEDHYAALKEQYNDQLAALEQEKKLAEERRKEAEKQYDDWMDTWKDIQKSIETPARDISEILNDIARYGTPAMADQVDRVTDLLRELGYAIEDVTAGGGYDPGDDGSGDYEGMTRREIIDRMLANGRAYAESTSPEERQRLKEENQKLGAMIGAHYENGSWDIFDYGPNGATVKPGAYEDDWGQRSYSAGGTDDEESVYGPGVPNMTAEDLLRDGWDQVKHRGRYLSTTDYADSPSSGVLPYASYSTSGDTVYNDDHSVVINGLKLGTDMLQRSMRDVFSLFSLNMGN